jgi:hypothetical protein
LFEGTAIARYGENNFSFWPSLRFGMRKSYINRSAIIFMWRRPDNVN